MRRLHVHVGGHADGLAGTVVDGGKRQHRSGSLQGQPALELGVHALGRRDGRIPEPPQLAILDRPHQIRAMLLGQGFQRDAAARQGDGFKPCHSPSVLLLAAALSQDCGLPLAGLGEKPLAVGEAVGLEEKAEDQGAVGRSRLVLVAGGTPDELPGATHALVILQRAFQDVGLLQRRVLVQRHDGARRELEKRRGDAVIVRIEHLDLDAGKLGLLPGHVRHVQKARSQLWVGVGPDVVVNDWALRRRGHGLLLSKALASRVPRSPWYRKPPGGKTGGKGLAVARAGARRVASRSGKRLLVSSTSYPSNSKQRTQKEPL